jgi:hypothetical protein
MSTRRKRSRRLFTTVLFAGVLAFAAYAFTAGNVIPGSQAGHGGETISGYTVSNVAYSLNASNPGNIDSVTFTLTPAAAGTVKMQLVTGGSWYSCTHNSTTGNSSCSTTSPQGTVSAANNLTVLAVQ